MKNKEILKSTNKRQKPKLTIGKIILIRILGVLSEIGIIAFGFGGAIFLIFGIKEVFIYLGVPGLIVGFFYGFKYDKYKREYPKIFTTISDIIYFLIFFLMILVLINIFYL